MRDALGYYAVLDVEPSTDIDIIKTNYRDLAKYWHPDSNKSPDAMEHFQKLSVAYDVLKNEDSRLEYDLLSEIYDTDGFPDMKNLNILKDKNNNENPLVRVINIRKVIGKLIKYTDETDKIVCSYDQAKTIVLTDSLSNWFLGWWHPKAFIANIKAIINNYISIGHNTRDNLILLVHNALAYHQEEKDRQSMISALQALKYADAYQQELINRFIKKLDVARPSKIPEWRYVTLRMFQLIVPLLILLCASYPLIQKYRFARYAKKENNITYFQKVNFNNGKEITDDVVVSKIFSIPVDLNDKSKLYHFSGDVNIMYGPAAKFDVMFAGKSGQTVRVTGFTPDRAWYRIMIDSGEMGFVQAKALQQGIGTEPPYGSKIVP